MNKNIKNNTPGLNKSNAKENTKTMIAQSAGAVEYTDCTSAEG